MSTNVLEDAFGHHVWATIRIIDACSRLTPEQLQTTVPGTYGSIIDTIRHTVGADRSYLALLSGERVDRIDEDAMDLAALRRVMEENGPIWTDVVTGELDADEVVVRRRDDGSTSTAPLGIRVAQVPHHGTDHRTDHRQGCNDGHRRALPRNTRAHTRVAATRPTLRGMPRPRRTAMPLLSRTC